MGERRMIFETISVFPGVFDAYLSASIMGRAERAGICLLYTSPSPRDCS